MGLAHKAVVDGTHSVICSAILNWIECLPLTKCMNIFYVLFTAFRKPPVAAELTIVILINTIKLIRIKQCINDKLYFLLFCWKLTQKRFHWYHTRKFNIEIFIDCLLWKIAAIIKIGIKIIPQSTITFDNLTMTFNMTYTSKLLAYNLHEKRMESMLQNGLISTWN